MSKREKYVFAAAPAGAKKFWKSLEEKAAPEVFAESAKPEFPLGVGDVDDASSVSRRGFLTIATATAAAIGLEGCVRRPVEEILPLREGAGVPQPRLTDALRDERRASR